MRVVLLPSNVDGSGCYRCLLPGRELRLRRGWDVRMAPHRVVRNGRSVRVEYGGWDSTGRLVPIDRLLLSMEFEVLWLQQRPERWVAGLIKALRAQGKRVVVDSDDAWLGLPAWNPGSRLSSAEVSAMLAELEAADGLSVATPALRDMYGRYQPNVRVVRNRLDWWMWQDVTPAWELERRRVRFGWMGELHWRAGDLNVLRGVVGPWLERHPEVEFVAVGDPRIHDLLGVPAGQRVSTASTEFWRFDLADIAASIDVGLVPLDLSDAKARRLNDGKSHLKGMEYAAVGAPCIASPSESYRWWIEPGVNGLLARRPKDWFAALDRMLDVGERHRMGQAARLKAEQHSLQNHVGEWEAWIADCCSHSDTAGARVAA